MTNDIPFKPKYTCDICGAVSAAEIFPKSWTCAFTDLASYVVCDSCAKTIFEEIKPALPRGIKKIETIANAIHKTAGIKDANELIRAETKRAGINITIAILKKQFARKYIVAEKDVGGNKITAT